MTNKRCQRGERSVVDAMNKIKFTVVACVPVQVEPEAFLGVGNGGWGNILLFLLVCIQINKEND